jgi:hypothetical protein
MIGDSWFQIVNHEPGGTWSYERRVGCPERRRRQDEGWTVHVERRWGLPDRRMQVREREMAIC